MTITVGTPPPPGPTAGGLPPQDWDGYVFPPGCGGYGCPSGMPAGTPSVAGRPVSPIPSHTPSTAWPSTAGPTIGPTATPGTLAQTGFSHVFVTCAVVGSLMIILGVIMLLALRRRHRTP